METQRRVVSETPEIQILPYSRIQGQGQIKLALELAYIAPRIGGVLLSGQRGTGKSTAVRAFAKMMYRGSLPVTLPINATEDRVVGGWKIDALMNSESVFQKGLLEDAHDQLLYIDEVNLLDDNIVNIILDVTSTGVLVVQREGLKRDPKKVSFILVGTMNPEEGGLRPQLLDRFGLMVSVESQNDRDQRQRILKAVLEFDEALSDKAPKSSLTSIENARQEDEQRRQKLEKAKENLYNFKIPDNILNKCVELAQEFKAQGNRGDYTIAIAARACAALENEEGDKELEVKTHHVKKVARLALEHRRAEAESSQMSWSQDQDKLVTEILK